MKILWIIAFIIIIIAIIYFSWMAWLMHDIAIPPYTIQQKTKHIEIRTYPAMLTATIIVEGNRQVAMNKGFKQLAAYIFGENHLNTQKNASIKMTVPVMQQSKSIAMTAPVMQESQDGKGWKVQFVMPAKYTLETLPKPNNKSIQIGPSGANRQGVTV